MTMPRVADNKQANGVLYIVSTPIGNLEDITVRAIRILKEVNLIAAEDTRRTLQLLDHYDIHTPLTSYFDGNQGSKGKKLIARLKAGESIALVSEAGTPTISDPGHRLVVQCIDAKVNIIPIPGTTACITAASVAGLPLNAFVFEGFLSSKSGKRRRQLTDVCEEKRTLIFYESPHRLMLFLQDALEILGDRHTVVARELTKKFEEIFRGVVSEAIRKFEAIPPRGEFTILIEGNRE